VPVEPVTRVLLCFGVALLFVYFGLYTAIFALLVRRLGLWAAPLIWPLLEFVKDLGQVAFPWDLLGYSMTPYLPFIQPAALGGVYLVSSWVVLINLLLYRHVCFAVAKEAVPVARRVAYGAGLVVTFAAPYVFAYLHVKPTEHWFNVSIVQPNVSPLEKGDRSSRERIYADLLGLTAYAGLTRPALIVCPETATLVDVTEEDSEIGGRMHALVDSLGIDVFTGTPLYDSAASNYSNGAVLLRPGEGSVAQRYRKMRLVPFSEKIPYSDAVPFLRKFIGTRDMGNWIIGTRPTVFDWSEGTLSCLICYEAIFPDLAREFVRRGADLLVVVTNDGWFGRLPGSSQHAELAVMRAVEQGVPMVRSANNGISFIVDPYGRVVKKTELFVKSVLRGPVWKPIAPTPYRRFGDWFIVLCLAGTAGFAAFRVVRAVGSRRKRKNRRSQK